MKSIKLQIQHIGNNNIPPTKEVGWISATMDNVKISIDAYKNGSGYSGQPRVDCFVEIADRDEVFETTPEQLMHIIRFFVRYSSEGKEIVRYKNRYHYIASDEFKTHKKG